MERNVALNVVEVGLVPMSCLLARMIPMAYAPWHLAVVYILAGLFFALALVVIIAHGLGHPLSRDLTPLFVGLFGGVSLTLFGHAIAASLAAGS
jgi:hypothetical protein